MARHRPPRSPRTGSGTALMERDLARELDAERNTVALLEESLVDLEREMNSTSWVHMTALAAREFSPQGMYQIRAACRLFAIKSALIKRGLNLRSAYVWGEGVEITARSNGRKTSEQDVQGVVADFLTDPGNLRSVTGPEARDQLEHTLGTDGNVYVACFTLPVTGQVSVRVVPTDEIFDVITNPDDVSEPWFYHRRWYRNELNPATGTIMPKAEECYYPALGYRPVGAAKLRTINNWSVRWDAPIVHVAVNRPVGWKYGIPDAYAALDWAKAYKEFLEDWARLVRSLSRFAFKATAPGAKSAQLRQALAAAPARDRRTGEPDAAGATAVITPDVALEAISKSGATIDSDSGRPLATMVAAALDVPVTMLLADPGQTGARATAETLDQPTELAMSQRREVWTAFNQQILGYVITESVRAPKGTLKGQIRRDPVSGREYLTLNGPTTDTVDVTWPDLSDTPVDNLVDAIQKANDTGTVPPEVILRLLLTALGVRTVDEIVEQMVDEDGQFIWPGSPPLTPGTQLAALARAGADPSTAGTGPMADTEPQVPADGEQPGDKAPVNDGG